MALTGYERQKRYREKNRARFNLGRRNKRKALGGTESNNEGCNTPHVSKLQEPPPAQLPEVKVSSGKFPKMITLESLPKAEVAPPPTIYRNDYGAVISQGQWEKLQEIKQRAKEGGWEIDRFSQL